MTVKLTLIAHAPTVAIRAAAFPLDEGIDEKGRAAASALSADLPQIGLAWCSPARRAVETASALKLEAKIEPLLRDMDLGRWAGRSFADVEASEPQEMMQWLGDPASSPHGGEAIEALLSRVANWLKMTSERPGRSVAVTHAAVIRAAIIAAIDAKPVSFWRIDVAPLSIVELSSNGHRWALKSIRAR